MRVLLVLVLVGVQVSLAAGEDGLTKTVGPFAKDEYPQAVIDRPLTLPAGMVEGEMGATFTSVRFHESIFGVDRIDSWDGDVTLRVGVTDRIQVEAGTAFSLDYVQRGGFTFQGADAIDLRPSLTSWRRVVPLRLSFLALDTNSLDTALTLTLPFTGFASRTIAFSRGGRIIAANGTGRVLPEVDLAAPTRWRLTDWFWLRAGENLFAVSTDNGIAAFSFDFGIGVQPHPSFAVTLDSSIASIAFDGSGEVASRTLTDFGTIDLEGTFSPCRWFDFVGGLVLPDVGRGFDDYLTRVAVRVRL